MKLPAPPPMTSNEIVGHLRDHWIENIGADAIEAESRAERGFMHMLQRGSLREWGFDSEGNILYEPHTPAASQTIVYVLLQREER